MAKIIYTRTDEAPLMATYSLLPIVERTRVQPECRDPRHLAGRPHHRGVPEYLTEEQRIGDALSELGELATKPEANIIAPEHLGIHAAAVRSDR